MPYLELEQPSFARSGKSIEEILYKGTCGGVEAVRCYLKTRRSMLLRELASELSSDNETAHKLRVAAALEKAVELLSYIELHRTVEPAGYKSVQKAMGGSQ